MPDRTICSKLGVRITLYRGIDASLTGLHFNTDQSKLPLYSETTTERQNRTRTIDEIRLPLNQTLSRFFASPAFIAELRLLINYYATVATSHWKYEAEGMWGGSAYEQYTQLTLQLSLTVVGGAMDFYIVNSNSPRHPKTTKKRNGKWRGHVGKSVGLGLMFLFYNQYIPFLASSLANTDYGEWDSYRAYISSQMFQITTLD